MVADELTYETIESRFKFITEDFLLNGETDIFKFR